MSMNIVRAKYPDSQAFLRSYQTNFPGGGVFIPTRKKYELGSSVVVDVRFPELRSRVLVRGVIAWRRAGKRRTKLRAGVGVEFLATEQRKREFLLGVARGDIVDLTQRRHRRLPVEIRVDWRQKTERERHLSTVEDIGEGGAFIRTTHFLPIGSAVILEITAPGGERKIAIEGVVAWTCHTPDEEGMGVEFRCRDIGGTRLLKELVRRIERFEAPLVEQVAG
jgi:type IV pilus assembly protein PilZ